MEFLDSNLAALQALKLFSPFGLVIIQVSIHCSEKNESNLISNMEESTN